MDDLSELLIDSRTDERFNRLFRSVLKKNKLSVTKRGSKDYYIITDGEETLGFDISAEKYTFAVTKDPETADRLVERIIKDFGILTRLVSFTNGQEFLRFTLMRSEEIGKNMIAEPFIGNLKKVMCYTGDNITARILDVSYMKKWDVPREVMFSVADRNMCRLLRKTDYSEGAVKSADAKYLDFKAEGNDFTAALIMCSDFHDHIAEKMGERFLVAVPSKDSMLVMSEIGEDMLDRIGSVIAGEYRWTSRPLTTDIFLYTPAGIKTVGHISEIEAE